MATVKRRPNKAAKRAECLVRDCKAPTYARGLCTACYQAASKAVREGTVTDEELVGVGLMLRDARGARSSFNTDLAKRLSK